MKSNPEKNSPTTPFILIVDDAPINKKVLAYMLKQEAYRIVYAENGAEALSMIRENHPDLILLDVIMPEMDGFEVCRKLKADERTREIPIIFLTARADLADIVKGFELGAADYVTKPFNSSELLARVRIQLELKRSKDSLKATIAELRTALSMVKQLSGLLPICAKCKKIRDDRGYWNQIETYIRSHSEAEFSHGLCPECARVLYPDLVP